MKVAVLALPAALLLAGCSNSATFADDDGYPMGLPENLATCPDDPPQACTMEYMPAYGYGENGAILGEFANQCSACMQEGVKYTSKQSDAAMPGPADGRPAPADSEQPAADPATP